jgi:hypothetical protein
MKNEPRKEEEDEPRQNYNFREKYRNNFSLFAL